MFDLVIKGGTVVTSGSLAVCDIGVRDGAIAQIGGDLDGARVLDARGKCVFPGGVDIHVHLTSPVDPAPGVEVRPDDFYTGSLAAIAGGVTTVGNMTFQRKGEGLRHALERDLDSARRLAAVDYILHPVLTDPVEEALRQIPDLAAAGHTSLKFFMVFENFDTHVDAYLQAMRLAAQHGMLVLVHCEDGALIRHLGRELIAEGKAEARYYPESRPVHSESAAVDRAVAFARATGATMYVVHLSSAAALESCRRARADGLPVYVETRPLYLYLTRERFEEPDGAKYAGAPALREEADREALWHGLQYRDIQCVCTDHAPWTLSQKLDPALTVATFRQGVADLQTLMPMLFSEGVLKGRISLARFVELTATNAAKLFGMYPRKGTIAVGSDADLAVWDPQARQTIDGATMFSKAAYSPYDGWEVTGWPAWTISRGEVVFENGQATARPGRGRWVRRNRTTPL